MNRGSEKGRIATVASLSGESAFWRSDKVTWQTYHGENVSDVIHHDIHASKLRPDLHPHTDVGTVDQLRRKQFPVCDVLVMRFEFAHVPNVLQLLLYERMVWVALADDVGDDFVAFFPAVPASEPSWTAI